MSLNEFKQTWYDSDVERHWDNVAHKYVAENNRVKEVHDQRFKRALELLDFCDGQSVLNISSRDCGLVPFIREMNTNYELLNAEISSGLINEAAKLHPEVKQKKLETYSKIELPDDSFDRILSFETLEHVENPVLFLSELKRVTKNDGLMVLSCPPATAEISYRIYSVLFGGHGEGPHRFPSSKQVKQWLDVTGWTLLHHEGRLLIPVGPRVLQNVGEKIIQRFQKTFVSELGIRQFYVCKK